MADSFDEILAPRKGGAGFVLDVPDGWQQGRGAFGGLTLGAMARAISASVAAERPLRALDAQLLAPVLPGPLELVVTPLREGNAVSTLRVEARQEGAVVGHAVGVCAAARASAPGWTRLAPPVMTPWRDDPPMTMPSPPAPVFTQHFEYRTAGGFPYAASVGRPVEGWVRPRVPARRHDAAYVAALADAWWPVVVVEMQTPRPIATVTFGLQILTTDLPEGAPLYHRAVSPAAADGYSTELRELWTEDGRLVSLNQQVIAIIK